MAGSTSCAILAARGESSTSLSGTIWGTVTMAICRLNPPAKKTASRPYNPWRSGTMILTRDVIRREIEAGRVVIEPFFADQVGPASIDLHLGDEIRVMHAAREPVPVTDDVDYRTITDVRSLETPYPLAPGETIHGIT